MNDTQPGSLRPTTLVLGVMLVAACAWVVLGSGPGASTAPPKGPELPRPVEVCQQPSRPAHRADEARRLAELKMAHYPFDPADGLAALALAEEALACLGLSDSPSPELAARVTRWRRRVQRDYRGAQLRLRQALSRSDEENAAQEARYLAHLLGSPRGDYGRWLGQISEVSR